MRELLPPRNRIITLTSAAVLGLMVLLGGTCAAEVENVLAVSGFWGSVTGKVESAQADGHSFVLAVTKAEPDAAQSVLKDGAPLVGKELTIGVRMPKKPDGTAFQNPEDVAYVKTLKPGMVINVKLFAPRSAPRLLRIQGPGQSASNP